MKPPYFYKILHVRRLQKGLIRIYQNEFEFLLKQGNHINLVKTSASKKHGSKTYYINNDDHVAINTIAAMRDITVEKLME